METPTTSTADRVRSNCYSCRWANATATVCAAPLKDRETRKAWGAWIRDLPSSFGEPCPTEATGCPVWSADPLESVGASL